MNHQTPAEPKVNAGSDLLFEPEVLNQLREHLRKTVGSQIFNQEQIEIIYSIGHSLFVQGKFDNARIYFQVLMIYRPLEPRFLFAYGLCCKNQGQYSDAVPAFTAAIGIEPTNLKSAGHLVECLVALGKKEESLEILEPLIKATSLDNSFDSLRMRAEAIRTLLQKND
jgi:tetratricopeptide (TPR) repeat protein